MSILVEKAWPKVRRVIDCARVGRKIDATERSQKTD